MRILLTGARAPVTLDLARRFDAAGHEVYLVDSLRCGVAAFSRAVCGMRRIAAPALALQQYADDLEATLRAWRIDLLIPMCEEIFFIAHQRQRLDAVCRVFADAFEKLERIHNKWKFSQRNYTSEVAAPESILLSEISQMQPFLRDAVQWVFKPVYSRFAAETKIGPSAAVAATIQPSAARPWLAQRRVLGKEYCSYSIAQEGRLLAHAVYWSPYRVGLGSGIYFVPCEHPAIESFVRAMVAAENYTGQIGFDFIEEPDGRVWVLEANPRATSGLHLFGPQERVVEAFLGKSADVIRPVGGQPRMVGMAMALWGLGTALRRGQLRAYVRDCWRARDVMFQWRDPLPTLLIPLAFAEIVGVALRQRRRLTAAATYDIEWNGEPL